MQDRSKINNQFRTEVIFFPLRLQATTTSLINTVILSFILRRYATNTLNIIKFQFLMPSRKTKVCFVWRTWKTRLVAYFKVLSRMTGRADENKDQHHSPSLHGENRISGTPELSRDVGHTVAKFRAFHIVRSHIGVYFLPTKQKCWNFMAVICTDGEHLSVLTAA